MVSENTSIPPPSAMALLRHVLRLLRKSARLLVRLVRKTTRLLARLLRKTARLTRAQLRFAVAHVAWLLTHCPLPLPWFPSMRRKDQITQLSRLAARHNLHNHRSIFRGLDLLLFSALWPIISGAQTLRYVWKFSTSARYSFGVSTGRQILRCWRLAL